MTEIVVEQRIAAPPSAVYRFLTESDKWSMWQGLAELDVRVGGLFSVSIANGMRARGEFVELVPDERVVFTWGWVDQPGIPPGSTVVDIELIAEPDGTRLVLTHRNVPDQEAALQRMGWSHYLPRLSVAVEGGHLEPDMGPG